MEKQIQFTGILSNKAEENPGPLMIIIYTMGIFGGKENDFSG